MTQPTEPELRLYNLAGTVDGALNAYGNGTLTADEALQHIYVSYVKYKDAARADASAAVAAAEVPDELASPVDRAVAYVRSHAPANAEDAAKVLGRWEHIDQLTDDQVAEVVARFRHRVTIRTDGGHYALTCTGCSSKWISWSLRAAEETQRVHEGSHR